MKIHRVCVCVCMRKNSFRHVWRRDYKISFSIHSARFCRKELRGAVPLSLDIVYNTENKIEFRYVVVVEAMRSQLEIAPSRCSACPFSSHGYRREPPS